MKIKLTETELTQIVENAVRRVITETTTPVEEAKSFKKYADEDYVKAKRKGSRDAEKEIKGDGFNKLGVVHKSKKDYERKPKNLKSWDDEIVDDMDENVIDDITEALTPMIEKFLRENRK